MRWRSRGILTVASVAALTLGSLALGSLALGSLVGERASAPPGVVVMPAGAPMTVTTSVPTPPAEGALDVAQRGELALEQISYPWRTRLEGWTIVFSPGRDGVLGLTYVEDETIEVFVRDDQSIELIAHVVAHELGHAVDVALNDGDERRRWQEARGIESAPWWPDSGANDFATGAGDFAESFAVWQVGSAGFRGQLAGAPDASQLGLMAELAGS